MFISVIVPCRNAAAVLGHQLEALARQRCSRPWEVVVVDNGSTDETKRVAAGFDDRLPRLVVVEAAQKAGAAYARNAGVAAARGEYVAFCDADDEVALNWLESVETALNEHPVVAFRQETGKLNAGSAALSRRSRQSEGLQAYAYPPYLPYSGTTIALPRRLFLELGGFDESLLACEDADFCWRLQHAGAQIHFARDAVVHVRLRETPAGMCRQARLWGEYNVALYKKFRPLGMPAIRRTRGVRNLLGLVRRSPELLSARSRMAWLWQASWVTGRVIGSIKYRVWAL